MKKELVYFLLTTLLIALVFSACSKPIGEAEPTIHDTDPTPTPTPNATPAATQASRPKITPGPKGTPQPKQNVRYDWKTETVQCPIDTTDVDYKTTWKIYKPIGTPDPNWTIESVDGDIITYSSIRCDHETPDPYAFHPEDTESVADTEAAEDTAAPAAEATPAPEE